MAAYSYTFTGADASAWETGWHTVAGTVAILSNKGRTLASNFAYAHAGAYFDGVTISQDTDIYVDAVIQTVAAAEFYAAVNIRAGSSVFDDVKQRASWHCLFIGQTGAGFTNLYRISGGGVATYLEVGADKDFVQGDTLHMRFSPLGTRFRCKYWRNSDPEPAAWDIDYNDTGGAPTGSGMSLMIRNGNTTTQNDWRWDNLTVSPAATTVNAAAASGVGNANIASTSTATAVGAGLASGTGTAYFDASGGSTSVTLEAIDAVESRGAAFDVQKTHLAGAPSGNAVAYNATVTSLGSTVGTAGLASGTGAANNATVTRAGNPAATVATGTKATATPQVTVSTSSGAGASTGTAHAATIKVAPQVGYALSVGTAPAPGITASGTGPTTNVSAAVATGAGASNTAQANVALHAGVPTGAGTAYAPSHSTTSVYPAVITVIGSSVGSGYLLDENGEILLDENGQPILDGDGSSASTTSISVTTTATGVGAAYDAQANVGGQNFAPTSAIPIFAFAFDPNISIQSPAGFGAGVGVAHRPNQTTEIGQTITHHDHGHTVTVKER